MKKTYPDRTKETKDRYAAPLKLRKTTSTIAQS